MMAQFCNSQLSQLTMGTVTNPSLFSLYFSLDISSSPVTLNTSYILVIPNLYHPRCFQWTLDSFTWMAEHSISSIIPLPAQGSSSRQTTHIVTHLFPAPSAPHPKYVLYLLTSLHLHSCPSPIFSCNNYCNGLPAGFPVLQ